MSTELSEVVNVPFNKKHQLILNNESQLRRNLEILKGIQLDCGQDAFVGVQSDHEKKVMKITLEEENLLCEKNSVDRLIKFIAIGSQLKDEIQLNSNIHTKLNTLLEIMTKQKEIYLKN